MNKYIEYKTLLLDNLNNLRQSNGVFRASYSEHYNATWIRDNFWCNLSYLNDYPSNYLQTCHTHLDFLHKWENEYDHKVSWLVKDTDVHTNPSRFIHPKVNFDGSEIEGLEWQFLQADTLYYIILMFYYGCKNGMKVFRNESDTYITQKLIDAIHKLDIQNKDFAHSWEEERACFTSNLGLGMRALEVAYEMGFDIKHSLLQSYRLKFYSQFPYERSGREWDLTLLFLCVIDGILKPIDIEEVLKGIHLNLERDRGIIRYLDDVYLPFDGVSCDTEMEWCMGFGYLAIIYANCGNTYMARFYIDKLMNTYPDGMIPEGVNRFGESCFNTPLAWSLSMTIQAINKLMEVTNE